MGCHARRAAPRQTTTRRSPSQRDGTPAPVSRYRLDLADAATLPAPAPLSQITPINARRASSCLSVTTGAPRASRDAPVLAELLDLHVVARPVILDCTFGRGGI